MARCWVSFDEVRTRVRIKEVMEVLGVDLSQYREGPDGSLTGPCCLPCHPIGDPLHRNPRQFRVDRIRDRNGVPMDAFKCFSTDHNVGGSTVTFAKLMLERSDAAIRYFFADHWRDRLSARSPSRQKVAAKKEPCEEATVDAEASPQGTLNAPANLPDDSADDKEAGELPPPMDHILRLDPSASYLEERGVSPATIDRYGLGYASRGRMAGYVCLPVFGYPHPDSPHPLVYLGRLAIQRPDAPKYKWGSSFPKGRILVGLPQAMENIGDRPLLVVEGPFDMFAVVDAGYPHVVCIVGSDMTDAQAELLVGLKCPVVLMFDADPAGSAGARKAAAKLICDVPVRVVKLPEGKDPADLPSDELRSLLEFLF